MTGPPEGPAGIVTRLLAAVLDAAVTGLLTTAGYLAVVAVRFAAAPWSFRWPTVPPALAGGITAAVAVVYLTVSWATLGRGYGAALLGLRVLGRRRRLGWVRALVRALLCVVFPIGLLWVAVSPHRRSLQDVVLRTTVVYDWRTDGGRLVSTKDAV
ncbi:RDD family protein [Amycolatopsis rhabdoformis]|uniref:RDD family protein n=1 Tax=Amycolatopsis rhabdoformis TaxID=1448059 RepID=A0ABZ1IDQ6_9PSEU|nr:RDD family protein [Amycolatopsis rhabdoformis]WSE31808.1 RDD family protein [Amycolatopsis rhabdoformis]